VAHIRGARDLAFAHYIFTKRYMMDNDPLQEPETEPAAAAETPPQTLPEASFDELPAPLKDACARAGWTDLMPVQKKAMPYVLAGRDVMVQARTGSGKTGAFILPLLTLLDRTRPHCQAMVLVPTRELALQVASEAQMLAGESGIKVVTVIGGVGYGSQIEAFRAGAQLVVGTPGRILDHLMNRNLSLDRLKVLIFDEADRMLSIGFYPDMKKIQRYLPQNLFGAFMFSATFPPSVLRLADQFLHQPDFFSLSGKEVHIAAIEHAYYPVPGMGKERRLIRLIEMENPTSAFIFCNTKKNVHYVAEVLKLYGFSAEALSSDLTQAKRDEVLTRIREGKLRFLVATDVAARGIDVRELSHVFLFEPPEDPESYIHRAGRTGRAGASGTVITMADVKEEMELKRIAQRFSINLQRRTMPEDEEVAAVLETRLMALLEARRREITAMRGERVARFLPLARKLAEDEESLVLLAMLLDEAYQGEIQAGPQAPEPTAAPAPRARTGGGSPGAAREGGDVEAARKRRPRRRKPRAEGERE